MHALILLGLFAAVTAQGFFPFWGSHGDRIHGYYFTYHDNNNLLVIRNDDGCWLVDISGQLRDDMHHKDTREEIEDRLYNQIISHQGETPGNHDDIREKYHDRLDSFRCLRHTTYNLVYQPPTD